MLQLYNTLTKRVESFKPLREGQVGMYNCGPTVYDYAHIGNLRAYVFADTLRRTFEYEGYAVRQIINITDFGHLSSDADSGEDKMLKGLKREGKPLTLAGMRELADFYTEAFRRDLAALNVLTPTALPHASDHIPEQIDIIRGLTEKGFTYETADGVYFDTTKDPHYGALGGLSEMNEEHARVATHPGKRNPRDFALWKKSDALGWDSPWGRGFPGWHIECSAMSMHYLGDRFDIHTGGKEHIPVHHNNEIAQSDSFTGHRVVSYWLHHEWVNLGGAKIAKSLGTGVTLKTLAQKSIEPLSFRYWLLTAHYRSPTEFSWEALEGGQNAYRKLTDRVFELGGASDGVPQPRYRERFTALVSDDLDTPGALALLWELLKNDSISDANKKATALDFDQVLGLGLATLARAEVPKEIQNLAREREVARKRGDWKRADALRDQIRERGYEVRDGEAGPQIAKR